MLKEVVHTVTTAIRRVDSILQKVWNLNYVCPVPSPVVSNLKIIVQKFPKHLNALFWKQGRRCKVCGREAGFITMAIKAISWKCRLESGHPLKRHSFVSQKILNISYHEDLNTLLGEKRSTETTKHFLYITSLFLFWTCLLKEDIPTQFYLFRHTM
jgi:ribosomal protein S14